MTSPVSGLRCRQIAEADIPAVSALLARGFHKRSIQFWERALDTLGKREPPPSLPKYGYLIERNGIPVGALLVIGAARAVKTIDAYRCSKVSFDPGERDILLHHASPDCASL
jgi:hypothetical protein